jgi:hypothetical protein
MLHYVAISTHIHRLLGLKRQSSISNKLAKEKSCWKGIRVPKTEIKRMFSKSGSVDVEPPSKPIMINQLVVTQYGYRDDAGVAEMVAYVRAGGEFNAKPLISLFALEDGRLYIHDGHHRSMAIYLSGREYLKPTEYAISPFTFEQLQTANFATGYVTPYDPRVEMRLCDFRIFKKTARQIYEDTANPNREKDALQYIQQNRSLYAISHRPYETIPEMIEYLGLLPPKSSQTKL